MNVIKCALPDLLILEPKVFSDERGFFYESYNARALAEIAGITAGFVQDNYSHSVRNVLRGMHYQVGQAAQGKLIRAMAGEIFDVVVDVRPSSPTFGKWVASVLSGENNRMLWVPPGFAHGFLVTSAHAEVRYKTTTFWAPQHERCILWNDPELGITWPLNGQPIVSAKDRAGLSLKEAELLP